MKLDSYKEINYLIWSGIHFLYFSVFLIENFVPRCDTEKTSQTVMISKLEISILSNLKFKTLNASMFWHIFGDLFFNFFDYY